MALGQRNSGVKAALRVVDALPFFRLLCLAWNRETALRGTFPDFLMQEGSTSGYASPDRSAADVEAARKRMIEMEDAARKRAAEIEDAAHKKAAEMDEAARKRVTEMEDAAHKKAAAVEEDTRKRAEEMEGARKRAAEDAARKRAEEDTARKRAAEEEAAAARVSLARTHVSWVIHGTAPHINTP